MKNLDFLVVNLDNTSSSSYSKCTVWNKGWTICCLSIIHFFLWQFLADRVNIFKQINMKLQTFKLSKVRSKQRYTSSLSTSDGFRQRWCQICFDETSKVLNSIIHDCDTYCEKILFLFLFSHTSNLHGGCLSRVSHIYLKIKRP